MNESSMEIKQYMIKYSPKIREAIFNIHTLLDCGVIGIALIDKECVFHHQLEEKELKESR
jgi:hypothetical protein